MSFIAAEIASQPETWQQAATLGRQDAVAAALPGAGERVAVIGCGTSLYVAQACAAAREAAGAGETDAFPASEFPAGRHYDRIVALTRSGTTTEILRVLRGVQAGARSTVITTAADHPAAEIATDLVVLDFADERSIVQTRFATTTMALWRAALGDDLDTAVNDARTALATEINPAWLTREQFVFLGTGWTVGLANEAALKLREAAQAWTESYPAMEFRHGPISVLDERSLVWMLGATPPGLGAEIAATGARLVPTGTGDPMAQLITAQRLAVALAERRGLDPDAPRHLIRSIVLSAAS